MTAAPNPLRNYHSRPAALLVVLALLTGCQASSPPTPCEAPAAFNAQAAAEVGIVPASTQPTTPIGRRGVRVLDERLASLIYVEDVMAGRKPNGAVEVATRILNCSAIPLQVEGAAQFSGASGMQAESPSNWQRLFLPPRTNRTFSALSTGPRPVSFVIELREGR